MFPPQKAPMFPMRIFNTPEEFITKKLPQVNAEALKFNSMVYSFSRITGAILQAWFH